MKRAHLSGGERSGVAEALRPNERKGNFMTSPEQADERKAFEAWIQAPVSADEDPGAWLAGYATEAAWQAWKERARLAAVALHPAPPLGPWEMSVAQSELANAHAALDSLDVPRDDGDGAEPVVYTIVGRIRRFAAMTQPRHPAPSEPPPQIGDSLRKIAVAVGLEPVALNMEAVAARVLKLSDDAKGTDVTNLDAMVARFLQWRLPENFAPDCGISFARTHKGLDGNPVPYEPVGTNLLTYEQAKEMLLHVLAATPQVHPAQTAPAADYRAMWLDAIKLNQQLCAALADQGRSGSLPSGGAPAAREADERSLTAVDAARYRWLRGHTKVRIVSDDEDGGDAIWASSFDSPDDVDAAIDAAMSGVPQDSEPTRRSDE
jgi:hypothetical protein